MKKATLRLVISVVAMLGIATTQLEMNAFAQEPAKISVTIPKTFNLPIAKPAIRWSDRQSAPAASQAKSGKKKWILLAVAGAGGATAVYFVMHKKETPTITVGNPTIGLRLK